MFMVSLTPYARGQHHCEKNEYVCSSHEQSKCQKQSIKEVSEEVTFSEDRVVGLGAGRA